MQRTLSATNAVKAAALTAFGLIPTASTAEGAAYSETVIAQNPLVYWRFNDAPLAAGGSVAAEVGGAMSQAKNASGVTEGIAGPGLPGFEPGNTAFAYDGGTNAVTYDLTGPGGSATGLTSNAGSVSYWFRRPVVDTDPNTDDARTAVHFFGTDVTAVNNSADGFSNNTLHTWLTAGGRTGLYVDTQQAQTETSAPYRYLYSDNNWHHVVATWNRAAGTLAFYIDGGEGGDEASGQTFVTSGVTWDSFNLTTDRFGKARFSSSRFFLGEADELAIWDRALTETEALAQYTAAIPEPGSLAAGAVVGLGLLARRRRRA